jgi:hypothetical protein
MTRLLLFVLALGVATPATAVDNTNRVIGLGAYTAFSQGGVQPQISAKFSLRPKAELSLLFGMQLAAVSTFTPGARFAYVLIPEKNMNLFVEAGLSFDLRTRGGLNAVLFRAGPGVEVFLTELPNLGLLAEFGLEGGAKISNPDGDVTTRVATGVGGAFGGVGIHYYF